MKTANSEHTEAWDGETKSHSTRKQQLFEKVRKRLAELGFSTCTPGLPFPEANPDVIVISDDQSLLFEPQNPLVINWFKQHLRFENLGIRVHPAQSERMAAELKAAGFEVV